MTVLSGRAQKYTVGDYSAENNDWGHGSLVIGQDYTQQVSINDSSFPNGVTMSWSYPNTQPPTFVYGYPEVIWGNKLGYLGTMNHEAAVGDIENLTVDYSVRISGDPSNFAVGIEIWTSDKPWNVPGAIKTGEIMIKVHGWQDGAGPTYSDGLLTATEVVHYNWSGGWTFVTLDTSTDKLSGTLSFSNILHDLVAQGIISPTDYVSGVELGAEIARGTGSMQVDLFSVEETLTTDVVTIEQRDVEALFIGYFGRAGGPSGVDYWVGRLDGVGGPAMSEAQIAASFAVQNEATGLYPFLANPMNGGDAAIHTFVDQVFMDLFNRQPASDFWFNEIKAHLGDPQKIGEAIVNIVSGASGTDAATLQNKVTVASYFSDQVELAGRSFDGAANELAHSLIKPVTSDPSAVIAQEHIVNSFLSNSAAMTSLVGQSAGFADQLLA